MSVYIHDIFNLEPFKQARLLTSSLSNRREISEFTVHDVPMSPLDYTLTVSHALILSSFFGKKDSEDILRFFTYLIECDVSGLITTNEYVNTLPQEAIDLCNEEDFPIILIDSTIPYSLVIHSVLELLIMDQRNASVEQNIDMLCQFDLSREEKNILIQKIYPHLGDYLLCLYIQAGAMEDADMTSPGKLPASLPDVFHRSIENFAVKYKGGVLGIVSYNVPAQKKAHEKLDFFLEQISRAFPDTPLTIGVSALTHNRASCDAAIKEAMESVRLSAGISSAAGQTHHVICYDELGIMRLLLKIKSLPEAQAFSQEVLSPVLEQDKKTDSHLFDTVIAFLENNRNYKATAQVLYVHENTVRHRIAKARQLVLEQNPGNDFFELFSIASKLYLLNQ